VDAGELIELWRMGLTGSSFEMVSPINYLSLVADSTLAIETLSSRSAWRRGICNRTSTRRKPAFCWYGEQHP
jgi:hypothetical protein